jgi:hypothetical protein
MYVKFDITRFKMMMKFSLGLIKHYTMRKHGGEEIYFYEFLT